MVSWNSHLQCNYTQINQNLFKKCHLFLNNPNWSESCCNPAYSKLNTVCDNFILKCLSGTVDCRYLEIGRNIINLPCFLIFCVLISSKTLEIGLHRTALTSQQLQHTLTNSGSIAFKHLFFCFRNLFTKYQ